MKKCLVPVLLIAFVGAYMCACGDGNDCIPNAKTICKANVVYWVDSCGVEDEKVGDCGCGCNADFTACSVPCSCVPECGNRKCGKDLVCGTKDCGTCADPAKPRCDAFGQCKSDRGCTTHADCNQTEGGYCDIITHTCKSTFECTVNSDCNQVGDYCDVTTHTCKTVFECTANSDCNQIENEYCDLRTHTCKSKFECMSNSDCDLTKNEYCDLATHICKTMEGCVTCVQLGKECGKWDDRCGKVLNCGTCDVGTCNTETGNCGIVCVPDCEDHQCGWDPVCGAVSCGTCPGFTSTCNAQGQCVVISKIFQLAAGYNHSCALTEEFAAYCWGSDADGQLGNGADAPNTCNSYRCAESPVLVDVSGIVVSKAFMALSAGDRHTCGLTPERHAYCWGNDDSGQLGNGAAFGGAQLPVMVDVSGITGSRTFSALAAGAFHTCGLTPEGEAFCWGSDADGQLGNGPGAPDTCDSCPCAQSPVMVDETGIADGKPFERLSAGYGHTCALTAEGAAYCWGWDVFGQLGNGGSAVDAQSPVMVDMSGTTGRKTFIMLSAGGYHTCGLTPEGNAYCWGRNDYGQLGNGPAIGDTQSPVMVDETGITGNKAFVTISSGEYHTCGNMAEGATYCWGADGGGELGDGPGAPDTCSLGPCAESPVVVDVSGMTGTKAFVTLSAGAVHTCGVTPEWVAYCWGFDYFGQLGNGAAFGNSQSPVAVDMPQP